MGKIKILHFELDKNPGGIESFLLNMYSKIDRTKYQFDFVTRYSNPAKSKELIELGGNIHLVSNLNKPLNYYKDLKNVLSMGYDIVHIHKNSAANIIPLIIAHKIKGLKIIVHSHNTAPSIGRISGVLHFLNQRRLVKYSDYYLACSDIAGKWLFGNSVDFKVVKNGIDTQKYLYNPDIRRTVREKLGIKENAIIYGNVGHFTEQKNHRYLVDLFEVISEHNPQAYLLLIGDGILKDEITEKIRKSKINSDRIFLLGIRSDVNELMQAMDYFIMPSLYEGLPIAAVEAQASGLSTLLASTISKETEVSSAVHWFDLDNVEKVAEKILSIDVINDRRIPNTEVIKSGFDANDTANFLEELYSKCVKKKEG